MVDLPCENEIVEVHQQTTAAPKWTACDLDDDGRVNFGDFAMFAASFGHTVDDSADDGCRAADFDGSGKVDFGDFAEFAASFGQRPRI